MKRVNLQCVDKFCYLGDLLDCGGGAGDALSFRVSCTWGKFRELAPILAVSGMSLRMKGKIYGACVQSVMVYGSETWALKASETQQLVRVERMMARWMCGVSLRDRKSSQELYIHTYIRWRWRVFSVTVHSSNCCKIRITVILVILIKIIIIIYGLTSLFPCVLARVGRVPKMPFRHTTRSSASSLRSFNLSISSTTHSIQVFLLLPLPLRPSTSNYLHFDNQSSGF